MESLTHCWHGYRGGRLESENGAWVSSEENWKKEPPVAFVPTLVCAREVCRAVGICRSHWLSFAFPRE